MDRLLSAEFLAATYGDMHVCGIADCLADYAALAPVPLDSGRLSGSPRPSYRGRLRAFYLSAVAGPRGCPVAKRFYERRQAEGKGHTLLALGRRPANALRAMICDGARCQATPPVMSLAWQRH
ncbi:transposase [Streptomyces lavendulocolor]|uniref:transposase n=1 Tax=Streptomyces lavendulocolor TaxID=67316 RepID=UPI0033CB3123